ncbi:MAG: ATP-binding cassette domain-containing protein, partial [Anaeroplasmataceae bacterium]|nr:ATP-binding cassette domain-containing protein [Anaeroplasmataceae bacterium]
IKIEHLNKYYNKGKNNEIHVINDVTLELPNTGLISFLGASGSGKTTLLNVIGGLDKAKGSITYDDLTLENYKMHQVDRFRSREIGYVFQNYNLLLEETVYSNLEIALEMIGIFDKEEQEKRIEYTLKAVGMYKYRKKRAYALSGGQQQRVSIARALVKKSKIIIADEPTGNLDNENTIEVMNILKKVSKTSLVLVVTHNEEVASFYSDEVIRIKDGSIIDNYKSDGSGQLKTEQNNTIYLKDLSLQEEKGNLVSLQYYTTKEAKPLELRIIEKNGTYYVSASEKLKLLDETNIKVLDSHYEALKQESVEQFDYDTSWFSDAKGKDNPFKRLWNSLKTSFNKMRFSKKRAKFLYFSFFLIGIILAICTIGFANYYIVDDSQISVDPNFQVLKTDSYLSYEHFRTETIQLMDAGEIEALNVPITMYTRFFKSINYVETANQGMNLSAISFYGCDHLNFLIGKAPEKNEVVISQKVADTLIKNSTYFSSYQDLLGIRMTGLKGNDYIVCGVVDNPYLLVYINDNDYLS